MSEVPRDRWQRPLIVPPDGGDPVPYARASSYGDVLEDRRNLEKWLIRTAAVGLSDRPDLLLSVAAHRSDKRKLDRVCDEAVEAAKGSAKATTGTALHALTELVDQGSGLPQLPDSAVADLEAYRQATAGLHVEAIETFVVLDRPQVAGTFDRIVEYGGDRYVADIKTGSVKWGQGKIAVQLAVYANGDRYDPETGTRAPLDVSREWGLVIHLPQGEGECHLFWVDLDAGWRGVELASEVRGWRRETAGLLTAVEGVPA